MAGIKEELELKITTLKIQKYKTGEKLTQEDILKELDKLEDINIDIIDGIIEGEYKDYEIEIDETNKVTVGGKAEGEKPTGIVVLRTTDEVALEVKLQVVGEIKGDAKIVSISALEGQNIEAIEDPTNGDNSQMFKVTENGKYSFRIKASNGRSIKITSSEVVNATPMRDDILSGIALMSGNGKRMIRVKGTTASSITDSTEYKEEVYSFRTVYYKGNLSIGEKLQAMDDEGNIVEGEEIVLEGLTQSADKKTWYLGLAEDVNTRTALLKVDGNLTIQEGIKLTSINSSGFGTKGIMVYSDGVLTVNGVITMSAIKCSATSQALYLFKNLGGNFIFANGGGNGGSSSAGWISGTARRWNWR